ncbi:Foie gras liver health family 1-domain-containing protein [Melanogaster broomeanus]|nr:Foie gras liver health family 1-domain-containing protein [Melanogaster broomeanus]
MSRLRDVLQTQFKPHIWAPERTKTFQMIVVDNNVRFPPRKLVPPEDPSYATAHSPLSPLTPSSPLYPDGLIAPIWIRKHTALVPSTLGIERERVEEERRMDTELSAEIAQRKKTTNERGIKLAVVLMASRRILDDVSLESRLTSIRKQSGLDSRAALFVLSPVSPAELHEFVRSLQDALYEPAVEYYISHSKRVRRKRNRHSQAVSSYNPPPLVAVGTTSKRPLRPEGWTVRYEYKMACFAEFRGEDEVALKHYQDAYTTLMIMFGSTAILPPRTKRWAEAKVLADTVNFKITKLYLYNNEHALALSHHNLHMRRFADFSRGWGIGEETFEYWSWMARQWVSFILSKPPYHGLIPAIRHRALAELLEQGSRSSLTFPSHTPASRASGASLASALGPGGAPLNLDAVRTLGLNPSHALQHPGHYYYMAARMHGSQARKVFGKREYVPRGKFGSWICKREEGRTLDDHIRVGVWSPRFFERIAKTYRREKWNAMLRPLFSTWYACAQKLGDVELTVRLLVEMIGYGNVDEPGTLQDDLLAILRVGRSLFYSVLVVDLKESEPILNTSVVFWKHEVRVGDDSAFQISLIAPSTISTLPVDSVTIIFSEDYAPIIVHHKPSESSEPVRLVRLGQIQPPGSEDGALEFEAHLRWKPDDKLILVGTVSTDTPGLLSVGGIPHFLSDFFPFPGDDYSRVIVRHRPHQLAISFSHPEPALLDEEYPITIEITNIDDRHLDVVVDVLLQPSEVDEAVQYIVLNDHKSSGLIKGIRFGTIAPGVSVAKTLLLISSGAPVTVKHSRSSRFFSDLRHQRDLADALDTDPLADLSVFEKEFWDDSVGGEAVVRTNVECSSPWALEVESLQILRLESRNAKVVHSSTEESPDGVFPGEYLTGDQFCDICRISLAPTEDEVAIGEVIPGPGEFVLTWRRTLSPGNYGPRSETRFSLPPLRPPRDGLIAMLTVPTIAKLHIPIPMDLTVRNCNTSSSAVVTVSLDPHPLDGFVVAGLRSGRLRSFYLVRRRS